MFVSAEEMTVTSRDGQRSATFTVTKNGKKSDSDDEEPRIRIWL
jgi:hypothetical protein